MSPWFNHDINDLAYLFLLRFLKSKKEIYSIKQISYIPCYVFSLFQINSILLIFLLRQINRAAQFKASMSRARPCAKQVKAWLRRTAMLLPVLGVTWLFGFLTFISSTVVFHYLFTILNSLQGFFIFVTFCILDDAVSLLWLCFKWYIFGFFLGTKFNKLFLILVVLNS